MRYLRIMLFLDKDMYAVVKNYIATQSRFLSVSTCLHTIKHHRRYLYLLIYVRGVPFYGRHFVFMPAGETLHAVPTTFGDLYAFAVTAMTLNIQVESQSFELMISDCLMDNTQ